MLIGRDSCDLPCHFPTVEAITIALTTNKSIVFDVKVYVKYVHMQERRYKYIGDACKITILCI